MRQLRNMIDPSCSRQGAGGVIAAKIKKGKGIAEEVNSTRLLNQE